ncbi:MAG: hypothetical protein ACRDTP_11540 [Mycobacteriales bacterium]
MTAQPLETLAPPAVPSRRPLLRLVRTPARKAARMPFVLLVVGILGLGLVGLLLLNTQRAQASFRLTDLQHQSAGLQDQEQALQRVVERDQDPAALAARATALGMVPDTTAGYLAPDGSVVGPLPPGASAPVPGAKGVDGVVVAKAPSPKAGR